MAAQLLPEMSDAEASYMMDKAGHGRMWSARALANAIGLTEVDRVRLGIATIAATDCTRAQRKKWKQQLAKLNAAVAEGQPDAAQQPRS